MQGRPRRRFDDDEIKADKKLIVAQNLKLTDAEGT